MDLTGFRRKARLLVGAGALAIAAGAANADSLVKDCGKDGKYVIGFSQANNAEPYRQHVNDELTAAAAKVPQFTLQIADGAGNVNTQTSQMDNFITQKVDLILISPFEAAPLTPVVARAMKAGIPVIELDRKTLGEPGKDYTAFIGGDNFKIAEEAGKYVADKLLPEGGEVAVLEGLPSSTPAVERLNGFKDGVKANPKIQVVAEQAADWLPDKAQTAFAAMLQAHPNIKAVYASNDMMAAGARLAAKGAGKKDGDIKFRHRRIARPLGRHPRGRRGRMVGDLHLPDRRTRGDRHGEGHSAGLRRQGPHRRDGRHDRDHAGQRQGDDGQIGATQHPPRLGPRADGGSASRAPIARRRRASFRKTQRGGETPPLLSDTNIKDRHGDGLVLHRRSGAHLRFRRLGLVPPRLLPERHSAEKSRDMIAAVVGLVSLLLALVLGTLVGSAYAFYSNQKAEMESLAAKALQLDIALSEYGPETGFAREKMKDTLSSIRGMIWGGGVDQAPDMSVGQPIEHLRLMDMYVASLDPKTPAQRQFAATAGAAAGSIEQTRLLVSLQLASPVSWPLVAIVVSWAAILFCGFGMLSRFNATTVVAVALGAFAVGSALFLILELSEPFTGVFRVPSGAFDEMLAALGK